jgi:D-alanyl-D-alanine carboxypeptidase
MFQPKRQTGSNPVNRLLTLVISVIQISVGAVFFGSLATPAFAAGSTPTPTPEITIQPIGTPTPIATPAPIATSSPSPSATPITSPTPTPTPTPPIVCGVCFNPGAYSQTKASSLWVVVNKQRPLAPINYTPPKFGSVNLAKPAADAFLQLKAGMAKAGAGVLILNSGFRSYNTQVGVHSKQVARLGLKAGEALAARPGYSEHQTGLAADVSALGQGCTIQVCFSKTKAGKWLAANAWQYGFILRYPDGKTAITGYQFEPWHFRYVGIDLATEMKSQNISVLEKFWNLPAAPAYTY